MATAHARLVAKHISHPSLLSKVFEYCICTQVLCCDFLHALLLQRTRSGHGKHVVDWRSIRATGDSIGYYTLQHLVIRELLLRS